MVDQKSDIKISPTYSLEGQFFRWKIERYRILFEWAQTYKNLSKHLNELINHGTITLTTNFRQKELITKSKTITYHLHIKSPHVKRTTLRTNPLHDGK